jgi:hypothetical protein
MDPGSVRKTAPWAYCRNENCERRGVNQSKDEALRELNKQVASSGKSKPKPKGSPELKKALKTLLPKAKPKPKPEPVKTEPEAIQKARLRIREALAINGTYSKAVIGLTLTIIAQEMKSHEFANRLIDEFDLAKVYGIEKQG